MSGMRHACVTFFFFLLPALTVSLDPTYYLARGPGLISRCGAASSAERSPRTFASFNVWNWKDGPLWGKRVGVVVGMVQGVDVVAFQEVRRPVDEEERQRTGRAFSEIGIEVGGGSGGMDVVRKLRKLSVWFEEGRQDDEQIGETNVNRTRQKVDVGFNQVGVEKDEEIDAFLDLCAKMNGYEGAFQPAMRYDDGIVEGVAIFSKIKMGIVSSSSLHFVNDDTVNDRNRRVILATMVGSVAIASTHFSYDVRQREGQAVTAALFTHHFVTKYDARTVVVMGDFNVFREKMAGAVVLLSKALDLLDAHRVIKGAALPTYCNCGHFKCTLDVRPDRILVSAHAASLVLKAWTGPSGEIDKLCPSDHRAVFAEVGLALV